MSDKTETEEVTTATLPRVFIHGDSHFEDPGSEWTNEQMRDHLATYFPEIAGGTIETAEKDGVLEVTFSKRVTTKGSSGLALWEHIAGVQPTTDRASLEETVASLLRLGEKPVSVLELAAEANDHWQLIETLEGFNTYPSKLIQRCLQLPPIPTVITPIGF